MSRRTLLVVACSCFVAAPTARPGDPRPAELAEMQGLWHVLWLEKNGRKHPFAERNVRLLVAGDVFTWDPATIGAKRCRAVLDVKAAPKSLDLIGMDGMTRDVKTLHVFDLKGDRLYLHAFEGLRAGRERPKTIETAEGSRSELLILVRAGTIDPRIIKKGPRIGPPLAPGSDPAIELLGRFADAVELKEPARMVELVEVPWVDDSAVVADRGALPEHFRREIGGGLSVLAAGMPGIRGSETFATARRRFPAEARERLGAVLADDDILIEESGQGLPAGRRAHFLAVRPGKKPGDYRIKGWLLVPEGPDARRP